MWATGLGTTTCTASRRITFEAGGEFSVGIIDGRIVAMGALKRLTDTRAEICRMRVHP